MPRADDREPVLPLHLCQVLEEEYAATQRLPANALGWDIKRNQIDVFSLQTAWKKAVESGAADDPALAFSRHLLDGMAARLRTTPTAVVTLDPEVLIATLNELLGDEGLYTERATCGLTLRDEMLEYVRVHGASGRIALGDEDLRRFNRLLLEDAYPGVIEPIYRLRMVAILEKLHAAPRRALCLSGGGIRSGTFSLGVLQGLARCELLPTFHYLSTVSGGGYIGSWLTAWIHRHPRGLEGVMEELTRPATSTIEPEPEPVRYLREYSNFAAPRPGLVSADIWSFAAIYLRNLLINWSALIPLLLGALLLPRLVVALLYLPSTVTVPWYVMALLLGGGFGLSVLAVFYTTINRPSRADALAPDSWWRPRRTQGGFLRYSLLPTVGAGVCLSIFWFWHRLGVSLAPPADTSGLAQKVTDAVAHPSIFLAVLGAVGIGIYLTALAVAMLTLRRMPQLSDLIAVVFTGGSGGLFTWIFLTTIFAGPAPPATGATSVAAWYACLAVPAYCLVFFWAAAVFVAVTSKRRGLDWVRETQWKRRFAIDDEDREWLGRHGGWLFIAGMAWLVTSGLVVFGPGLLLASPKLLAACGGVSGLVAIVGGKSALTPANDKGRGSPSWMALIVDHGLSLAAVLFLAILAAALSLLTSRALDPVVPAAPLVRGDDPWLAILYASPAWLVALLVVGLGAAGFLASLLINLNQFSLHAAYRARIIRAFLGASRTAAERIPNPFTGFDPQDNIQMHELWPGLLREASFRPGGLTRFVVKLRERKDDRSKELVDTLSPSAGALIANHADANPPSQSLKRRLLEDLNRLLDGEPGLVGLSTFAAVPLAPETRQVLEQLVPRDDAGLRAALQRAARAVDLRDAFKGRRGLMLALNRATLDSVYGGEITALLKAPPPYRLLHVIGTALNLVGGKRLAWQQRRAESFTISPLHCGSLYRGYRRSRVYGGADGISLGTAVTISGAAVSSNMGYHTSSAAVTLALTLFNARLGWWLGNPGAAGGDQRYASDRMPAPYRRAFPRVSLAPLLMEAFGLTDDRSRFVLLSDGGHFENLGLYEMVLRRCQFILVVDGSQDQNADFSDLGAAIRKIRIDLGIDITFEEPFDIRAKQQPPARDGKYCAIATIRYADVDGGSEDRNGVLLYIKPAILGREPRDVLQYSAANTAFPHQSTVDQLFDESQFESYRRLGLHVVDTLALTARNAHEFVEQVYARHLPNAPNAATVLKRLEGV